MTACRALARAALIAVCATLAGPAHAAGSAPPPPATALQPSGHFHPKGKLPSKYTVDRQQALHASLPFEDQHDFEESKRGFIAAPPYQQIMAEAGNVAWDMGSFGFLLQGKDFDSIHPSLQRQAVLNMGYGLYEVVPGRIWQVRGFDLSNISFIKGDNGWIVFDPLGSQETAAAALALANEKLGYQKESSSLRNSFLAAAFELRSGIPGGLPARSVSPDTIRGMPTDLWLDDLDILLDSRKAEGLAFVINLVLPDIGERHVLEMSNATLTNIGGVQAPKPDLTVTINRADLEPVMMQKTTFRAQAEAGRARFDGNTQVLEQLMGCLVQFDQYFEIMPGTKPAPTATKL